MVDFSFIIVTYNSQHLIEECISSIFKYADIDKNLFEVIVVDNSNDENHFILKDLISKRFQKKVHLIHNSKNGGYGQGNNVGISASSGKYICIMNPDVRIVEPILLRTNQFFEKNQQYAMLGFKQIGGANISYYIKPEYKPSVGASIITKLTNYLNVFSERKFYLSGAFFFVRRKDIEAIGLFDEKIFLYFEEPDIGNRLLAKHRRIKFDAKKKYVHLSGGRDFSEFSFRNEMKSLLYYIYKFKFDRRKIQNNYMSEYKFNQVLFILFGKKQRAEKMKKEIEVMQDIFKNP